MSPKLPGFGDVDWNKFVSALTDFQYREDFIIIRDNGERISLLSLIIILVIWIFCFNYDIAFTLIVIYGALRESLGPGLTYGKIELFFS